MRIIEFILGVSLLLFVINLFFAFYNKDILSIVLCSVSAVFLFIILTMTRMIDRVDNKIKSKEQHKKNRTIYN